LSDSRAAPNDLALTLALLALLLWWEASGWDLVLAGWYGDRAGFALRDVWWTRGLLHDGGRWVSAAALPACALWAWRGRDATRPIRMAWFGLVLLCLLAVPALKQLSQTSCPRELSAFGGSATYVPHWLINVFDGGPGHCFPSGHAVAAFAFLPLYFHWRDRRPALARTILAAVLLAGALFGWAQLVRGAHFPSHTLWSAWLCWAVGAAGARVIGQDEDGPAGAHRAGRARAC
jgi:membrane-associated PAP2 superfamily phosphatase